MIPENTPICTGLQQIFSMNFLFGTFWVEMERYLLCFSIYPVHFGWIIPLQPVFFLFIGTFSVIHRGSCRDYQYKWGDFSCFQYVLGAFFLYRYKSGNQKHAVSPARRLFFYRYILGHNCCKPFVFGTFRVHFHGKIGKSAPVFPQNTQNVRIQAGFYPKCLNVTPIRLLSKPNMYECSPLLVTPICTNVLIHLSGSFTPYVRKKTLYPLLLLIFLPLNKEMLYVINKIINKTASYWGQKGSKKCP